jgi:hypothetical protein
MTFNHKYHRIRNWVAKKFGVEDRLYKLLTDDAGWIEDLISMRNAVEHPGGREGTLLVEDFKLVGGGPPWEIREPVWFLTGREPMSVAVEMEALNHNLLTLFEDLLCDGLERLIPNGPLMIYEIPEAHRDPAKPTPHRIHCLDRALDEPNPAEHAADRAHGVSRLHEGGRDLREQRGKEKEIAAGDEGDLDLEAPSESEIQGHGGIHPAEAAADDDDVGARKRVHVVFYDL